MFVSFKPGVAPETVELVKNSLRTLMTPLQVRVAAVFALFVAGLGVMMYIHMKRRISQLNSLLAQEKAKGVGGFGSANNGEAKESEELSKRRIEELEEQVRQLKKDLQNSPEIREEVGKLRSQLSESKVSVESVKKTIEEDKATIVQEKGRLRVREQELEKRERFLGERETELLEKEKILDQKDGELNQEKQRYTTERETFGREKENFRKEQERLIEDRKKLAEDRAVLKADREALEQEQEQLQDAKKKLETKENELKAKETHLAELEDQLTQKGKALAEKEQTVEAQQKEYTEKLNVVAKREQEASAKESSLAQDASRVDALARELAGKTQLLNEADQTKQKLTEAQLEIQRLETEVARLTALIQEQDNLSNRNGSDLEGLLTSGDSAQQRRHVRRNSTGHIDNKVISQLQSSSSSSRLTVPPSPLKKSTPHVPRTEMASMLGVKKEYNESEIGGKPLGVVSWPFVKQAEPAKHGMAFAKEITFKVGHQEHQASVFSVFDIPVKSVDRALMKKVLESLKTSFEKHFVQDYSDDQIEQALREAMQEVPKTFNFKKKPNQTMATMAVLLNNKVWVCTVGSTRTLLYKSQQEIVRLSERFDSSQVKLNEKDTLWVTSEVTVKSYSLEEAKNGWLILTNGIFYELYTAEQIKGLVDEQLKRVPSSSPKEIADHMMTTVLQVLGTDNYKHLLGHVEALVIKL
jgi:chromosome segregation ATPase/serine/threonine protein phosphatase PrpC